MADLTDRLTMQCGPQILKVPSDIEYNGRGPLVSARLVDTDLLWARGEQVSAWHVPLMHVALEGCRQQ